MIQSTAGLATNATNLPPTTVPPARFDRTKAMAPIAQTLGMSVDDLNQALQGGQTLNQLATDEGISHTDLINAIKPGLRDAKPTVSNGSAASATDATSGLDKLAEAIASRKSRGAHKLGHHHATNNNPNAGLLNHISKMLDMTSSSFLLRVSTVSPTLNKGCQQAERSHGCWWDQPWSSARSGPSGPRSTRV